MKQQFVDTPNWSSAKYAKEMKTEQKCKWLAFIKALQIIDQKAIKIGIDPDTIDLPNKQIYKHYIKPESETFEYYLSVLDTDNTKGFFIISDCDD
jgi:hypothetical protein